MSPAQDVIRRRIGALDGELEDLERQRQAALDRRRELAELEAEIAEEERRSPVVGAVAVPLEDDAALPMRFMQCSSCHWRQSPSSRQLHCHRCVTTKSGELPSEYRLRGSIYQDCSTCAHRDDERDCSGRACDRCEPNAAGKPSEYISDDGLAALRARIEQHSAEVTP